MDITIQEAEFSTMKYLKPCISVSHNGKPVEEHTNFPEKDESYSTSATLENLKAVQPQKSTSLLSSRDLILSTVDDVVNSITVVGIAIVDMTIDPHAL